MKRERKGEGRREMERKTKRRRTREMKEKKKIDEGGERRKE